MSSHFRKLTPLLNRVLIKKIEPSTKTKSGIILSSKENVANIGQIVAVGPGNFNEKGVHTPVSVSVGAIVLLPEFGGQKIELQTGEFYIFRDTELIGVLEEESK